MAQKKLQLKNRDENLETKILDIMHQLAAVLRTIPREKEPGPDFNDNIAIDLDHQSKTSVVSDPTGTKVYATQFGQPDLTKICSLWRSGGRQVCLYVAGSVGTGKISRLLQKQKHKNSAVRNTVFKIGTASPHRLSKRLAELCAQQYAAVQDGTSRLEPGFDSWKFRKIDGIENKYVPFFVDVTQTAWRITLPADMTIETFESELRIGLESRSLRVWSLTPAGLAYLREREIDPAICNRSTHYGMGLSARQSPSTELYAFDEKKDLRSLMTLVISIIERHVLADEKNNNDL